MSARLSPEPGHPVRPDVRGDVRPARVVGPRVARLLEELRTPDDARRAVLTAGFWSEVGRLGTPLVEELDGRPGHRAVTFLWRGHRTTRQVLLCANRLFDRERPADALLEHVPGTDIWQLGLVLRADHRGSYRMAADVSAKEPPTDPDLLHERLLSLAVHAATDPLNPRSVPTRWQDAHGSVFALPEAPAQPWSDRVGTDAPGRLERHRAPAEALGGARDTWVYLPPGHHPGDRTPLPVLVLSDGDMWFGRLGFHRTLDTLVADGALPPLAVLAPDAVDRDTRRRELGAREPFVDFLADELLPWAAGRWPLTTDPARTVVAGQSLGAVTALHAAYRRPERFGNVLAQSASLWWRPGPAPPRGPKPPVTGVPWLVSRYAASGPRSVAVDLAVGLHEGSMVDHHRALHDALRGAGHRVAYDEFNGGHDHVCWHGALADGLVRLLTS